jgi:hypothetical protein
MAVAMVEKPVSQAKASDLLPSKILFVASKGRCGTLDDSTSTTAFRHRLDLICILFDPARLSHEDARLKNPTNQGFSVGVCVTRHTPAPASQALTMYIYVLCTMGQYAGTLLQVSIRLRSHLITYQIYKRPQRDEYCPANGIAGIAWAV